MFSREASGMGHVSYLSNQEKKSNRGKGFKIRTKDRRNAYQGWIIAGGMAISLTVDRPYSRL